MKLERVRPGDWMAAAFGLGLLVTLWLDWFSMPFGGVSGWQAFGFVDLLVALAALLCLAIPVVTARCIAPRTPVALGVVATTVTAIALVVVALRLVFQPGPDAAVEIGVGGYLGLLFLAGSFLGTYFSMRDESMPGVPEAGPFPAMPAPPA